MVRPLHHIRAMSRLTMIPQPFVNNKKYAWCVYSPTPPFLPLWWYGACTTFIATSMLTSTGMIGKRMLNILNP